MKKNSYIRFTFVFLLAITLLFGLSGGFLKGEPVLANQPSLKQNYLDISGLSFKKAVEKAQQHVLDLRKSVCVDVTFENQTFNLRAAVLPTNNIEELVKKAREEAKGKNFLDRINVFKLRSRKSEIENIEFFSGIDAFISKVKKQAERQMQEPEIIFKPKSKVMFSADEGIVGVRVDNAKFKQRLSEVFYVKEAENQVALPVILTKPTKTAQQVVEDVKLRAKFSTNYSNSVGGRRHNVLLSLEAFNGLIVKPDELVSFNSKMAEIPASAFRTAKIIVNGEFVDGLGGGMCQASSTIYNATLLSGLEVLKSYSHSLPVGYVKFGFDAMVNPGGADLVFKNTTDKNIYIKTYGNNNDCFVEVYGQEMPKGLVLKRKSVNVGTIKHSGDKVIPDVRGVYSDKILFKGEYHRVKYPREGYEARSYLQYWVDGELVEEKYLRYSRYNAQQGILYEGVEDLPEGLDDSLETMNYPIKQGQEEVEQLSAKQIEEKMRKQNPSHFNP